MLLESLDARFPWGILVISDEGSAEAVPEWEGTNPIAIAATTLVVKIEHEQEGPTTVHICRGAGDLDVPAAFSGSIRVDSGVVTVGDTTGDLLIRASVTPGILDLTILLDPPKHATHVDVVIA